MSSGNGPPKFFFEAVEMVISGLPRFLEHLKKANKTQLEKRELILQALSVLKSMLDDFFEDIKQINNGTGELNTV